MERKLDLEALWHLADLDKDGHIDRDDLSDIAPYHRLPKPTRADGDLDEDRDG